MNLSSLWYSPVSSLANLVAEVVWESGWGLLAFLLGGLILPTGMLVKWVLQVTQLIPQGQLQCLPPQALWQVEHQTALDGTAGLNVGCRAGLLCPCGHVKGKSGI